MRIASVVRGWPTQRAGGVPHVAHDRAVALAAMGHDIHVLTTGGSPKQRETMEDGVSVHYLPCEAVRWSAPFAAECDELCRRLDPDVIHLESLDAQRPWWMERPGNPARVATTLHGFGMGGWLTKWNLFRVGETAGMDPPNIDGMRHEAKLLRKTFDVVIGISLHEQTLLQDQYGVIDAKLVYNPIHPAFFDFTRQQVPHDRRMLCAAVSGHGERLFRLAERAAQHAGVEIVVVSNVGRTSMPLKIDSATAVVVPTAFCQGYDLTVAEALARRRPVIMSATGSYLREHQAGLPGTVIVPVGDMEALAAAMVSALPEVPADAADRHRPEQHAAKWLEAIGL